MSSISNLTGNAHNVLVSGENNVVICVNPKQNEEIKRLYALIKVYRLIILKLLKHERGRYKKEFER